MTLVLMVAASVFGQASGSATLRGRITDPTGAVIPNFALTLINEATKDERKAKTNDEGFYVFSAVPPGTYTLRVEGNRV